MADIEITENEIMNYRRIASAVDSMMKNPDSRRKLLEAQKIANPKAVIPEIDATDPLKKELSDIRDEIKKEREAREAEKNSRAESESRSAMEKRWESGRLAARNAGYTTEGLDALEKFMVDKGIADHEIAIPAFERINPPSAPVSTSNNGFDLLRKSVSDTNEEMKKLMETKGLDNGAVSSLISKTLNEIRSR